MRPGYGPIMKFHDCLRPYPWSLQNAPEKHPSLYTAWHVVVWLLSLALGQLSPSLPPSVLIHQKFNFLWLQRVRVPTKAWPVHAWQAVLSAPGTPEPTARWSLMAAWISEKIATFVFACTVYNAIMEHTAICVHLRLEHRRPSFPGAKIQMPCSPPICGRRPGAGIHPWAVRELDLTTLIQLVSSKFLWLPNLLLSFGYYIEFSRLFSIL